MELNHDWLQTHFERHDGHYSYNIHQKGEDFDIIVIESEDNEGEWFIGLENKDAQICLLEGENILCDTVIDIIDILSENEDGEQIDYIWLVDNFGDSDGTVHRERIRDDSRPVNIWFMSDTIQLWDGDGKISIGGKSEYTQEQIVDLIDLLK